MPPSSSLIALALALAATPAVAGAQAMVQPLPARTDADRLADTMRQLAVSPQDVNTLATAGELSLKLDDLTAAAGFFARGDKVDPRNPRVKAGEGALMVRSERPGEALRYFAQAESYGGDVRGFAADRGLAYDLVGDQPRAQQQYRIALKADPQDDETVRRYALSLGIAGKRDQAIAVIEPLLRKNDRAAWRSRAFILAMGGDQAGAEHIATTMMPPGMAQGLLPFFQRLPTLSVVDRAFAVHFGEVRASAERIADARMAPAAGPLAPEPVVQVAAQSAQPVLQPVKPKKDRRSKREREAQPVAIATATTPVLPPPPAYRGQNGVVLASTAMAPPRAVVQRLPQATVPAVQPYRAPVTTAPVVARIQPVPFQPVKPLSVVVASQPAIPVAPVAIAAASPSISPTPASEVAVPLPTPGFSSVAAAPVRSVSPTVTPPVHHVARASEDTILARIIAGLSIPAAELDAAAPPRPGAAAPVAVAAADDTERFAAQAEAEKVAAERVAAERKAALDKKAADRKAAADKKALAAKKAAAEEKAEAAKEAAEQRKLERANPERIWVQVAGGANEDDLPKAWKSAKAKAPDIFGSRGGWSTPLRATNRVLAGPFKTSDEARDFVNDLKKKGVSAFTFTSEAGQPVVKLPK